MPVEFSISELIRSRAFRRAVSFLIGIGVPAVVCLWLRLSDGLLLAVITALMFSFADDEGPLVNRFIALGRSAAGIALGSAGGYLLGGYTPLFWVLFIAAAFAAAWLNRAGRTAHIGARLAVGQIDAVVFLRDPMTPQPHEPDINALVRACDVHDVACATNVASGRLMLRSLQVLGAAGGGRE